MMSGTTFVTTTAAAGLGDGLFSGSSGNPVVPGWLGRLMFDVFFSDDAENDKYARHVRGSAGIAVFAADLEDKPHWVEVGRACQRFSLQATAMDVRPAPLNPPLEVAALQPRFARSIGIPGGRPDLVVRLVRGPEMPRCPCVDPWKPCCCWRPSIRRVKRPRRPADESGRRSSMPTCTGCNAHALQPER